ncbi:Os10g0557750 [Oryza sativa Japonica Group]|jgi:hypothetical protein|uniref:Os10g0557750 protein n=1 Tax=Oryza sativa subsp. japonica TaxID=39947 RepID=A0A0P0XY36_ORYSJ|nr:hypothetical protein EE612_052727 [Oryza sativa]BAT12009.1 Os10g0557750 [Oryza sativa Japonica Group]
MPCRVSGVRSGVAAREKNPLEKTSEAVAEKKSAELPPPIVATRHRHSTASPTVEQGWNKPDPNRNSLIKEALISKRSDGWKFECELILLPLDSFPSFARAGAIVARWRPCHSRSAPLLSPSEVWIFDRWGWIRLAMEGARPWGLRRLGWRRALPRAPGSGFRSHSRRHRRCSRRLSGSSRQVKRVMIFRLFRV